MQLIISGLFLASICSWALIFAKGSQFYTGLKRLKQFEAVFWQEHSLETLLAKAKLNKDELLSSIFSACMLEWDRTQRAMSLTSPQAIESFRERIERIMTSKTGEFIQKLEHKLLFLATLGSIAPFIGLLGTVLGVMNSFHAIGTQNEASLAAVAPGMSEALFTTALGLGVAIPAIVAYNVCAHYVAYFSERANIFCDDFTVILLRQLYEQHA